MTADRALGSIALPEMEFVACPASGGRWCILAEDVVYRFSDGRVEEVWSIVDAEMVRG